MKYAHEKSHRLKEIRRLLRKQRHILDEIGSPPIEGEAFLGKMDELCGTSRTTTELVEALAHLART